MPSFSALMNVLIIASLRHQACRSQSMNLSTLLFTALTVSWSQAYVHKLGCYSLEGNDAASSSAQPDMTKNTVYAALPCRMDNGQPLQRRPGEAFYAQYSFSFFACRLHACYTDGLGSFWNAAKGLPACMHQNTVGPCNITTMLHAHRSA